MAEQADEAVLGVLVPLKEGPILFTPSNEALLALLVVQEAANDD